MIAGTITLCHDLPFVEDQNCACIGRIVSAEQSVYRARQPFTADARIFCHGFERNV
jgi:hypothetical protein